MSVLVFLGLCAILTVYDWRHRAIPRAIPMLGAATGALLIPLHPANMLLGIVVGIVAGYLADLPAGDLAVGGMLGAWLGAEAILLVWVLALLVGNILWAAWEARMIDWPGEWAFTPFLLVPACGIVLTKGGW